MLFTVCNWWLGPAILQLYIYHFFYIIYSQKHLHIFIHLYLTRNIGIITRVRGGNMWDDHNIWFLWISSVFGTYRMKIYIFVYNNILFLMTDGKNIIISLFWSLQRPQDLWVFKLGSDCFKGYTVKTNISLTVK